MKKFITSITAAIFLIGCTQQNVSAPVSTNKVNVKKVESTNISKSTTTMDVTAPKSVAQSNEEIQENSGGFESSPILKMVGSALLTGIISGLVSKALQ